MATNSQIRVMLIDPVAANRQAICQLLLPAPDIEVVGIARDGDEGLRLARVLEPQAVLMDPGFSHPRCLHTIRTLAAELPAAHVIVLTASSDPEYLQQAMLAGARTFLANPPKAGDLIEAIRGASRG